MVEFLRIFAVHRSLKFAGLVASTLAAVGPLATAQTPSDAGPVASIFKTNCAICHAEDGAGTALGNRLKTPDLRTKEIHEKTSAELAHTIREGKNHMPAFGSKLDEAQIEKLIDYVRQFHPGPPTTPK